MYVTFADYGRVTRTIAGLMYHCVCGPHGWAHNTKFICPLFVLGFSAADFTRLNVQPFRPTYRSQKHTHTMRLHALISNACVLCTCLSVSLYDCVSYMR